ncbi:MAG: hypothetical protein IPP06_12065 [Saprospiraceae bacterium]|nr:hypothetical protein [Candidatus Vicinibacter affinis]MBK7798289.1 hypothetical protein [Candidatus Vicinibacter affinis]MBK9962022.1 hypothetical protein [Candidatus Vicinibacter affinis]MBP6174341.1 hypothetical protein [Saprospiraceae bacterium]
MYHDKLKNIQILELLQQLSEKEISNFLKFLRSGGGNHTLLACLSHLTKPKVKDPEELKMKIHQDLYPDQAYKDVRVRLLFSDLLKELKQFIHHKIIFSDWDAELDLLQFYRKRRVERLFENQVEQLKEKLLSHANWNENKYYYNYRLELEKLRYESTKSRYNPSNFSDVLLNFEIHVFIQRLRLYLVHLSFRQFGSELNTFPELELSIQDTMKSDWSSIPEVNLYLVAVKLFTDPENTAHYENFISQLKPLSIYLDLETKKELYSHALNYCIRKINKDDKIFLTKILDLYDDGVKDNWLLDNGVMNQVTYKNIITLCIRLGNFEQAEEKLLQYKEFVNKNDRESIFQFNHARILKERGLTRDALILLYSNRYKDSLIEIHARIEMIKIYHELKEDALLINQIQSTEKFINKLDKLGYHKKYYNNFCKYATQLNKLGHTSKKSLTGKELLKKLKNETEVIERSWLLKEVNKELSKP